MAKLVEVERLLEIVVRAGSQGLDGRAHLRMGGGHDDFHGRIKAFELAEHLEASHPRHPQVHHRRIEALDVQMVQRLRARGGRDDLVVVQMERPFEELETSRVVVDGEDAQPFHHGTIGRRTAFLMTLLSSAGTGTASTVQRIRSSSGSGLLVMAAFLQKESLELLARLVQLIAHRAGRTSEEAADSARKRHSPLRVCRASAVVRCPL